MMKRLNADTKKELTLYFYKISPNELLISHLVAKALSSAPQSLTSVFGMGTGGPSASSTPTKSNELFVAPPTGLEPVTS